MTLSFKDFISFMFRKKGTIRGEESIDRFIYASTMNKMRMMSLLLAVFMFVAFMASFYGSHVSAPYVVTYRYVYLSCLLIMLVAFALFVYAGRDIDRRYVSLKWIMPITLTYTLVWSMFATAVNAYALGFVNPSLYIAVLLLVPICVYMHPVSYVLIGGASNAAMLVLYVYLKNRISAPAPKTAVLATILFIIMVFTLMLYFLQFSIRVNSLTFEEQKKEIDDLNRAQNRFFSSMSHEIRTPINTIIGFNEMILREKVTDEVAEDAANIRAASNMLLHLINDILDMSRISSGQMKLTPASYRPGDMLSDLVGMLWMRAREKDLEFHVEVAPDIPSGLYGDEVRIKQILINVLNNAIKYTKQGSVTLSIQCNGIDNGVADIIYSVKDTGIGIRKESIPHLFTAFRRVDEDENRYIEGTGLGLAIVKELTELMGGTVSVNSVYTQGSTFVIEIPQTITDYSGIGKLDLEEKHRKNTSGRYRSSFTAPEAHLLVVDDNLSNLLVIKKLLRDTLVVTDTAESAARALEMTLERSYDLIFMDHLMPEVDGVECFRMIRSQVGGMSKSARVVALTANAGSEMRKLYLAEGFDGYLVKPVNASELEGELIRLLPKEKVTLTGDDDIITNSMSWMEDHRKKRAVCITTESVADIPVSLLERYNIDVIPHKVETKNGIFADGVEIDADGILDYMKDNGYVKPHAPEVSEHEHFFAKALTNANNVIHLTISGRVNHSGYRKAVEAAASFENVTVFDTGHLSSGQGILVIEACRLAAEGMSAPDIISRLNEMKERVYTSFIVDDLDHLSRSGQVSTRAAALLRAIMCHPVLVMKSGELTPGRFYFGTRIHAWDRYVSSCLSASSAIDKKALYITYVGLTKKELDRIKEMVEKRVHFENIYIQKASPAIAVNCGPGTFGLLYSKNMNTGDMGYDADIT